MRDQFLKIDLKYLNFTVNLFVKFVNMENVLNV